MRENADQNNSECGHFKQWDVLKFLSFVRICVFISIKTTSPHMFFSNPFKMKYYLLSNVKHFLLNTPSLTAFKTRTHTHWLTDWLTTSIHRWMHPSPITLCCELFSFLSFVLSTGNKAVRFCLIHLAMTFENFRFTYINSMFPILIL